MAGSPFTLGPDGLRLAVKVTPRASRTEITGISDDPEGRPALALRLAAPPVDGAANKALLAWLAKSLDLPKSRLSIASGETSRLKLVKLEGDPSSLERRLQELLAGSA